LPDKETSLVFDTICEIIGTTMHFVWNYLFSALLLGFILISLPPLIHLIQDKTKELFKRIKYSVKLLLNSSHRNLIFKYILLFSVLVFVFQIFFRYDVHIRKYNDEPYLVKLDRLTGTSRIDKINNYFYQNDARTLEKEHEEMRNFKP